MPKVRSVREWISNPKSNWWYDDEAVSEYEDPNYKHPSGDPDAIDPRAWREALMTRAYQEKLSPDELQSMPAALSARMRKDDPEIGDLQKSIDAAIKMQHPDYYNASIERRIQDNEGVLRDIGKDDPDISNEIARLRMELRKRKDDEQGDAGASFPADSSMRYSGYDITGRTPEGHKIIRLR